MAGRALAMSRYEMLAPHLHEGVRLARLAADKGEGGPFVLARSWPHLSLGAADDYAASIAGSTTGLRCRRRGFGGGWWE